MIGKLLILGCCCAAQAQSSLWNGRNLPNQTETQPARLTRTQLASVRAVLVAWNDKLYNPLCDDKKDTSWLNELHFSWLPLGPAPVTLVEAGQGCGLRGGQGANGDMWLIAWDGSHPRLIASPTTDFEGFLDAIKVSSSHGFHDVTLGWHRGGGETGMIYFRFDGRSYRPVSTATLIDDFSSPNNQRITDIKPYAPKR
jgi:hypothetical protein